MLHNLRWLNAGAENDAVHAYLESGVEHELTRGTILAVYCGDTLAGAMLFHNYHPDAGVIEVSAAATSRRWFTRRVINEALAYVFNEIGCQALVMRTSDENSPVLHIGKFLGFEKHTIPRLRGRNKSETILLLTDDKWASHPAKGD